MRLPGTSEHVESGIQVPGVSKVAEHPDVRRDVAALEGRSRREVVDIDRAGNHLEARRVDPELLEVVRFLPRQHEHDLTACGDDAIETTSAKEVQSRCDT